MKDNIQAKDNTSFYYGPASSFPSDQASYLQSAKLLADFCIGKRQHIKKNNIQSKDNTR